MKVCSACKVEKELDQFGKKRNVYRGCVKIQNREWYLKKRDKVLLQKKQKYQENTEVYKERNKKYHENNKEAILQRKKKYYEENKDAIIKKFRDAYTENMDFRIKHCVRRRTRDFIDGSEKYEDMIGCSHDYLMKWFEYNFELDIDMNMSWENFGEWQIDHVYPLCQVMKLPEDERDKYFTWENLRPVKGSYNASKNGKLVNDDIELIKKRADEFRKLNPVIIA